MNDMRSKFESLVAAKTKETKALPHSFERTNNRYENHTLQIAWDCYQAGAASQGEQEPVGYVSLLPDEFSSQYEVRFWQKVKMGTKLYAAPLPQGLSLRDPSLHSGEQCPSEWVSVKADKKPNSGQHVLILLKNIDDDLIHVTAVYNDERIGYLLSGGKRAKRVTHWMPLPPPPAQPKDAT